MQARIVKSTLQPGRLSIRDADGRNIRHRLTEEFKAGDEVVILPADEVCRCEAKCMVVAENALPAFGGYCGGMDEGEPFIKIDLNAMTHFCAVEGREWKWQFAEIIAHEVFHAVEDLVGEEFDHEAIAEKMTEIRERAGSEQS